MSFGQYTLIGTVYDGETKLPISKANVKIGNRNVDTDGRGMFQLEFEQSNEIKVFSSGFHEYTIGFSDISNFNRTEFYLTPLPEKTGLKISAEAVGVHEPGFEFIFDYEFLRDQLVVGSYLNRKVYREKEDQELKNCAITLFDRGEMTNRIIIPDNPFRFRCSPFGELFLEGVDYAILVDKVNNKIKTQPMRYKDFLNQVLPWTVAFDSTGFFVKIVQEIPQVNHYVNFAFSDTTHLIRVTKNKPYFQKTHADYSMLTNKQRTLAAELSMKQGFPEYYYGSFIRSTDLGTGSVSNTFKNSGEVRDLRPPYSPAFKQGKTLIITDCMNQWIYKHSMTGEKIDSTFFQIVLPKEKFQKIEQDRINEKLYAIHEREGVHYVREIDTETGALKRPMKIAHPFPKKVKIYNGEVFYIRENAQLKIKHLYKERID